MKYYDYLWIEWRPRIFSARMCKPYFAFKAYVVQPFILHLDIGVQLTLF